MMYWTNEDLLTLIAKSLVKPDQQVDQLPLGPSSTIVLELIGGASGMTIEAYVDD